MNSDNASLWSLQKEPAIKAILLMLQHKTEPYEWLVLDPESVNEKAVRIAAKKSQHELAAYIYTYAQQDNRYGLDLEFPYLLKTRADDQTIRLNDLSKDELLQKVVEHLELTLLS